MSSANHSIAFECPVLLHLRPAGEIVTLVSRYDAVLTIHKDGIFSTATSILDILSLAVLAGDKIRLTAVGPDSERMLDAVQMMLLTYTDSGQTDMPKAQRAGTAAV